MEANRTNVQNDIIDFIHDYKEIYLPYFVLNIVGIGTGVFGTLH